jgi:hypothetical protein
MCHYSKEFVQRFESLTSFQ